MKDERTLRGGGVSPEAGALLDVRAELRKVHEVISALQTLLESDGATTAKPFYTAEDLSERWQVSLRTVENVAAESAITATYFRGARRFSAEAVASYERTSSGRRRAARRRKGAKGSAVGQIAPDRAALNSNREDHV